MTEDLDPLLADLARLGFAEGSANRAALRRGEVVGTWARKGSGARRRLDQQHDVRVVLLAEVDRQRRARFLETWLEIVGP